MFGSSLLAALAAQAAAEPPAAPPDLALYADKYPTEAVNGVSFLHHPSVRAAVEAAVPAASIRSRILDREGQQTPIALRGGRLVSWGCEPHNCNDHEWTIFIDRTGSSAEICYHVGHMMGSRSRWFSSAGPSQLRPDEGCPA
jgi:hypothetical protein